MESKAKSGHPKLFLAFLNVFMALFTIGTWFFAYSYAQSQIETQRLDAFAEQQVLLQIDACERDNSLRLELNQIIDAIQGISVTLQVDEFDSAIFQRRQELIETLDPLPLVDCSFIYQDSIEVR